MKRQPEGIDINWVTIEVHWPFPTWVEPDLFAREFFNANEDIVGTRLVKMLNDLSIAINKGFANGLVDHATLPFKYWRKPDGKRKDKPLELKATLYQHPDYDKTWLYVEYA